MYNTKYECRYNKDDIFLDIDEISEDEKEYIKNVLYKEDLFNIFDLNQNDELGCFDFIIEELYDKLRDCIKLRDCMRKLAATIISENEELGLCLLFSYDFLFITHKCICEYLETGKIHDDNITILNNKINISN
jgi:hypothetical protein